MSAAWPAADHVHNLGSTSNSTLYTWYQEEAKRTDTATKERRLSEPRTSPPTEKAPVPFRLFYSPKDKVISKEFTVLNSTTEI